jgi:hypothetical protein
MPISEETKEDYFNKCCICGGTLQKYRYFACYDCAPEPLYIDDVAAYKEMAREEALQEDQEWIKTTEKIVRLRR